MLGRVLVRWRGVIGALAFGVVFWLARPTFASCLLGVPFLVAGLAVRFWASGYIGIEGRVREIGGRREERGRRREEGGATGSRIVSGPYRLLRHPLYIGNFLLVAGMLLALRPPLWLGAVVLAGFVLEYAMIVVEEERDLVGRRSQMSDVRCEMSEVRDGEERDLAVRRSQMSDVRCEMSEVRDGEGSEAKGEWREASGEQLASAAPVGQFLVARALVEWRTWVVTGVAWGLAVGKAMV